MKADRVFKNAKVYSVELDGTETRAEAVAVKDGRFVFVGSDAEVQDHIGENTVITDCEGCSLLPGFGDAHMHFALSVRRFGVADVSGVVKDYDHQTVAEVLSDIQEILKKYAAEHPKDPVIHGNGWEHAWFSGALGGETHLFNRHDLDQAVPDRPVVLDSADGHMCILNTKALEAAGLSKDTPEPKAGVMGREPDGMPNGYLQEPVLIGPVCRSIPNYAYTDSQHHAAFLKAQAFFHSQGFTLLSDCMEKPQEYGVIREMAKNGELKIRLNGVYIFNDETREEDLKKALDKMGSYDVGDTFIVDTAKYFADGNFAMLEPYEADYCREKGLPEGSGTMDGMLWDAEHLKDSMEKAQKAGLNIHVHSFGDLSTRLTIDGIINAQKNDPEHKRRNIIAHCSFVNDADKKRMGENGIIASIQPQWECESIKGNPGFCKAVGKERFESIYPNKSLLDAGVICAYGSDFTVNYPLPMDGISVALTRKEPKTSTLYENFKNEPAMRPEECVTLKDAIKGWTIAPAYQFHKEDFTGSIKVGKSAELVLLDGDIENTPAEDICRLKVKETIFKGESVFKR